MIEIKVTASDTIQKDLYLKIDETGDDDQVTGVVFANESPSDGDGFWWKKMSALTLKIGGIWADGSTEATLVFDNTCRLVEVRK